jgi:hypothetical protein
MISRPEFYGVLICVFVTLFELGRKLEKIHDDLKALREKIDKK